MLPPFSQMKTHNLVKTIQVENYRLIYIHTNGILIVSTPITNLHIHIYKIFQISIPKCINMIYNAQPY